MKQVAADNACWGMSRSASVKLGAVLKSPPITTADNDVDALLKLVTHETKRDTDTAMSIIAQLCASTTEKLDCHAVEELLEIDEAI